LLVIFPLGTHQSFLICWKRMWIFISLRARISVLCPLDCSNCGICAFHRWDKVTSLVAKGWWHSFGVAYY
jgi:hypothetical protein